jgi:glutathione synthase/RimK-type ligase-like ATP-grasp enzyme
MTKENLLRQMAEHIGCDLVVKTTDGYISVQILKDGNATYEYSHAFAKNNNYSYVMVQEVKQRLIEKVLTGVLELGILGRDKG